MRFGFASFGLLLLVQITSSGHGWTKRKDEVREYIARLSRKLDDLDEALAKVWLHEANLELASRLDHQTKIEWAYMTNLTDHNARQMTEGSVEFTRWSKEQEGRADLYFSDKDSYDTKRQLSLFAQSAHPSDPAKMERISEIKTELEGIYGKGKVCEDDGDKCLNLEPDIYQIMATNRDPDRLKWAWRGWRDATGPLMKDLYTEYVDLQNQGAQENGYKDMGHFWKISNFELPGFEDMVNSLWIEVKPLYQLLHAYVRKRLIGYYGDMVDIDSHGPIPAHLLGNMWAQQWGNIFDIVTPYPEAGDIDVTESLRSHGFDELRMFKTAEEFFSSIGLFEMTSEFWDKSLFVRPTDREVQCHASAWDFHNGHDYRIKMCTNITKEYLSTIHHEMGHIEYFMAYRNQPDIYRHGANSAFHEAVGDAIALSVNSRKHLETIGLVETEDTNDSSRAKQEINYLMREALDKIAFLPFGYLIDKWRWEVFSKKISPSQYNRRWWDLRLEMQGIVPPIHRTDAGFDPGSKYHVPANVPYIRYFISFIVQFQFFEAMCNESGHAGFLHQCDYYGSKDAGAKLLRMLEMGGSRPWPEALHKLTGSSNITASSMRKYFQPLTMWLQQEMGETDLAWSTTRIDQTGQEISIMDDYFD